MPFLTKTIGGSVFFFLFYYCFISPLKYVQCFEFPLENSRSELGYSEIYILLLALVVASRAGFGKLWFVLAVRQKCKERHLIDEYISTSLMLFILVTMVSLRSHSAKLNITIRCGICMGNNEALSHKKVNVVPWKFSKTATRVHTSIYFS